MRLPPKTLLAWPAIFLAVALWVLHLTATSGFAQTDEVLVLPFEINAPDDMDYLESGLPSMLTEILDAKGVDMISPETGPTLIYREGITHLDVDAAKRLTLEAEGRYAVYGTFTQAEDYISLEAHLVDGLGEREPASFHVVQEDVLNVPPAAEELAEKIYQELLQEEKISSIEVKGFNVLDPEVVLLRLDIQEGDPYDEDKINQEIKRIFDLGYFDDVQVRTQATPQGKEITLEVEERPFIKNIKVSGADEISEDDILEALTISTGSVINPRIISEDLRRIRGMYREDGYYNATVDYEVVKVDDQEADLEIKIDEGERLYIRGIEIQGAQEISESTLKDEMELRTRGIFSWITGRGILREELLDRDIAAMEAFYANKGFINARVSQPDIEYKEDGIYLTFHVEEGDRYKMGDLDFRGDLLVDAQDLREITRLDELGEKEEYFNRSQMHQDSQNLSDFYMDYGYAFAQVDPDMHVDEEEKKVNVVYNLNKGEKVYIGRVLIEGNHTTRDNVIRRELRLTDGDLFSSTDLQRSSQDLRRLDFFEQVDVQPVPTGRDDEMDLLVQVEEKSTGMLSAGAGYSSYDSVFLSARIQERNLFGKGYRLNLSGQFGGRTTTFDLDFWNPRVRDSRLGMGTNLYSTDDDYFLYDREAYGGRLRFAYTVGDYSRLHWHYRLDNYELTDIDEDAHQNIHDREGENWSSALYTALTRDTRDRRINPSQGTRNTLSAEYGGGVLQGDDNFAKFILTSEYYTPAIGKSIFHWKGSVGHVMENTSKDVPNFELFRLGGIGSVRGYKHRKLAPRFDDGEVKGGDTKFYTNFELIRPLSEDLGLMGLVFFDAGNVWDTDESMDLDLYTSVGTGIRWYSPMGPIRVEYGYALNDLEDSSRSQVHFRLGQQF